MNWKGTVIEKKLIITLLLLLLIILLGCDAPVTVAERSDQLLHDYNTLLAENDALKSQIGILEKAKEEITATQDEHNKLILDYHNLQTQYVILEAYSQTIRDQYTALLEQFSTRYVDTGVKYTELYKMNMKLIERYKELDGQIAAVHSGNVSILSDNLTDSEYSVFYKGWKLWWGEFND